MATTQTLLPLPQGPASNRDSSSVVAQTGTPDSGASEPQPNPTGRVATGSTAGVSGDWSATCTLTCGSSSQAGGQNWFRKIDASPTVVRLTGMQSWLQTTPPAKSPGWPCHLPAGPDQPPMAPCHRCHPRRRRLLPPLLHHHPAAGQLAAAARGLPVFQRCWATAAAGVPGWLRAWHAFRFG